MSQKRKRKHNATILGNLEKMRKEIDQKKQAEEEDENINFYNFIGKNMYITAPQKVGYNLDIDSLQKSCILKYPKMPQSFNFELYNLENIYNDMHTTYYFNTDLSDDEKKILLSYMSKCIDLINKYYSYL